MNRAVLKRANGLAEMEPVVLRLQSAAPCSSELIRRVEALGTRIEVLPARAILQTEDAPVRRPRYLVSGWACRYRHLSDGRRQIFDLVLPGEGVGVCVRPRPLASTSTAALTSVRLVDAGPLLQPDIAGNDELVAALQALADIDERRMLDQIVRLGRLTATERIAHLLLDVRVRLSVIGHEEDDCFPLPLTQEVLADLTGLSVVHVNRTLQDLRRQKLVKLERGQACILHRPALEQLAAVPASS